MRLKDAYHQKADAQLREWQVWIEQIKESEDLPQDRAEMRPRSVERLDDCYQAARRRLDELRFSSDAGWENAKQAVEQAMIALKQALDGSGFETIGKSVRLQPDRSHVFEPFYHRKGF
jgi:hypothetical protein